MICLLFVSALLSPVWKGGAFFKTLDFSKALVAWVLTFLVITSFARLRRIIFIQSASVAVIAVVSVLKGRSHSRLEGVIGGIYSNPNDLAFAIVLSLPFCFAFLLSTRSILRKAAWAAAMLVMCTALFMTASRAGFIDLLVTGTVCLWVFGIKRKRIHLVVAAVVVALVVGVAAGGRLKDRFFAISGNDLDTGIEVSAHGSYEQRQLLMIESIKGIAHYPLGMGMENFANYSGTWREVHVSYLQIAVEGGIGAFVLYLLFFGRGFGNLRRLRRMPSYDPEIDLFSGALYAIADRIRRRGILCTRGVSVLSLFCCGLHFGVVGDRQGERTVRKSPARFVGSAPTTVERAAPSGRVCVCAARPRIPEHWPLCFETDDDVQTQRSGAQRGERLARARIGVGPRQKLSYLTRWLPGYLWQRLVRHRPPNRTHLIFALADHFEPAIVPEDGAARAPYLEQEHRLERWCDEYPRRFGNYRDAEGRPFVHSYFYPAEQYDRPLVAGLAEHCRAGWGEIEIHLHHGVDAPDTAENTRRQLIEFRDRLAESMDASRTGVDPSGLVMLRAWQFCAGELQPRPCMRSRQRDAGSG